MVLYREAFDEQSSCTEALGSLETYQHNEATEGGGVHLSLVVLGP